MSALLNAISPNITTMIRMDHSHVLMTFHRYKADSPPSIKKALAETICVALEIHAQLEEEIFYPALRALMPSNSAIEKAVPEHDEMRRLIGEVRHAEAGTRQFDDLVLELMRDVIHHVAEEETILLPTAERALSEELGELGVRMTKRRFELVGPRAGKIASDMVRGMPATTLWMLAGAVALGALTARASRRG